MEGNDTAQPSGRKQRTRSESFQNDLKTWLNELTKLLPAYLLGNLVQMFEANNRHFLDWNLNSATMATVADTSIVIGTLKRYAKGNTSILFKLAENPIFPIYAPPELETEVAKYIQNEPLDDQKKLRSGWRKLKKAIRIRDIENSQSIETAKKIMARDPLDAPFLSMVYDTGSAAILSWDSDFDPFVRRLDIKGLGEIVGVYHRGLFSFFIVDDLLPRALNAVGELIFGLLNVLYDILMSILSFVKDAMKQLGRTVRRAISSINWPVIILLVIALAMLVFSADTRKKALSALRSLTHEVKQVIEEAISWIVESLGNLLVQLEKLSPYMEMSAAVVSDLRNNVAALEKTYLFRYPNPFQWPNQTYFSISAT